MKKIILTITICVVLLAIACSLFIHFAPVSYDANTDTRNCYNVNRYIW